MLSKATNYMEIRNMYTEHRKNMVIAERDIMQGITPAKITVKNKSPDIVMTPKREKILLTRDYLKEIGRISVNGLARKFEGITKNTRVSPDKQLVKDFTVIINDFIRLGMLRKNGSYRGSPTYSKIINPDNLEALRNDR